ncbi:MAG: glycosyl transferase [Flavobacteriaceae bacterium]|nr:MAG: glycosyl transferase [Flavobacteriaceae bacterium]
MNLRPKILVIRFSAFGDIAMCLSVIRSFKKKYPLAQIYFLSRPFAADLFKAEDIHFIGADLDKNFKGIKGVFELFNILKTYDFTHVADLHGVLRTHVLRLLFTLQNVNFRQISKGRWDKFWLSSKNRKIKKQLTTTHQRYAKVFNKLGFDFELDPVVIKKYSKYQNNAIGIAPFAKHNEKMYPLEKMEKVALDLAESGYKIYLFGGGEKEKMILGAWAKKHPNIQSLVGKFSLEVELKKLSQMALLVSMDSANMHLASLMGVRVISIWGATHPFAGFLGDGQKMEDCIHLDLSCSPCSVFGNKPCYKKTLECLEIDPSLVVQKIKKAMISGD